MSTKLVEALLGHDLDIGCSCLTRNPAQLGESERDRAYRRQLLSALRLHSAEKRSAYSDGTGTAERASVKTASLRSLAFVRLQRLSRKSSGCMLVHIVLRASSKERVSHLRNRARNGEPVTNCGRGAAVFRAGNASVR